MVSQADILTTFRAAQFCGSAQILIAIRYNVFLIPQEKQASKRQIELLVNCPHSFKTIVVTLTDADLSTTSLAISHLCERSAALSWV
jgi:hypothetical protein